MNQPKVFLILLFPQTFKKVKSETPSPAKDERVEIIAIEALFKYLLHKKIRRNAKKGFNIRILKVKSGFSTASNYCSICILQPECPYTRYQILSFQ